MNAEAEALIEEVLNHISFHAEQVSARLYEAAEKEEEPHVGLLVTIAADAVLEFRDAIFTMWEEGTL